MAQPTGSGTYTTKELANYSYKMLKTVKNVSSIIIFVLKQNTRLKNVSSAFE